MESGHKFASGNLCAHCGARADDGRLFCSQCGGSIRDTQLIQSDTDDPATVVSPGERFLVLVVRGVAAIAAVIFVFCPLSTFTQIVVFVGSIFLFLICHHVLINLDENFMDENTKHGYWPPKPNTWMTRSAEEVEKRGA